MWLWLVLKYTDFDDAHSWNCPWAPESWDTTVHDFGFQLHTIPFCLEVTLIFVGFWLLLYCLFKMINKMYVCGCTLLGLTHRFFFLIDWCYISQVWGETKSKKFAKLLMNAPVCEYVCALCHRSALRWLLLWFSVIQINWIESVGNMGLSVLLKDTSTCEDVSQTAPLPISKWLLFLLSYSHPGAEAVVICK